MNQKNLIFLFLAIGLFCGFFYFLKSSNVKTVSQPKPSLAVVSNNLSPSREPEGSFSSPSDKIETPLNESGLILFYGLGCPHCAKVESFIKENKIQEKISIEQREVYFNNDNQKLLMEAAKDCRLNENRIGVPFLWDKKNHDCIIGDQPIIDFFKNKLKF